VGPITGFRIINLRVHDGGLDKVAYPDLTIDIGTGDHVVIGLENGGGKGTLLGFLLHVFLPDARLFLPRLAQRRQRRQGEEKRIEHYVPGGRLPTHVVVELELPARDLRRPGQPRRVLAGACLYKPNGGGPSDPSKEFFWSARCVTSELTLASLGLRSETGRLLDHREWRAWLDGMRTARPDAEIIIHDGDANWGNHLRNTLKVDVEFVKSWLLAMNEDEGAADHVFTYGSSRAFIDTLVRAVAPPELVADINENLTAMAADADNMKIDRRREALLRRLVEHTEPLAGYMDQLIAHDRSRRSLVDALLITQAQLGRKRSSTAAELEQARQREREAGSVAAEANAAEAKAYALELLARLQVARLKRDRASDQVHRHRTALEDSRSKAKSCAAAAVLCEERTLRARIGDIRQMLSAKAENAEPERRAASSAAQAWLTRVKTDMDEVGGQHAAAQQQAQDAQEAEDEHDQQLLAAEGAIAEINAAIGSADGELTKIDDLAEEARQHGDLSPGQSVREALDETEKSVSALDDQAEQALGTRRSRQEDLDRLNGKLSEFEAWAAGIESERQSAQAALDQVKEATGSLADALTQSGLLDLDTIRLDDHAEVISDTLAAVAGSAGTRQLDVGVKAAAAQRAVRSLETSGLLPPRADIATACERASRLGARPGWTYLAELPAETARRFAQALPELADGIIVNVPDDFHNVVGLVREHRAELHGPVTIGLPSAFETTAADDSVTVILPDEAFWSRDAGRQKMAGRQDEHARHQRTLEEETARYESALRLLEGVRRWQADIGPGAQTAAEERLTTAQVAARGIPEARNSLTRQQEELTGERNSAEEAERTFRQQAASARARVERLNMLERQTAPREELQQRIASLRVDIDARKAEREKAREGKGNARTRRDTASTTAARLATTLAELNPVRADAESFTVLVAHADDAVSPEDSQADRALLAERTRSLVDRWRGLATDQVLQGELDQVQRQLRDAGEKLAANHGQSAVASARALVTADPSRTAADFQRAATEATDTSIQLSRDVGRLEETESECSREVQSMEDDVQRLQRVSQLPGEYTADDLPEAEEIGRRLFSLLKDAQEERQRANKAHDGAKSLIQSLSSWIDVFVMTSDRLDGAASRLTVPGRLTDRIDIHDRSFELGGVPLPQDAPEALGSLLALLGQTDVPVDTAKERVIRCTDEISGTTDHLQTLLDDVSRRAQAELETAGVILHGASEEVVAGDKLIQLLRDLRPSDLAAEADRYHRDASSRLAAVAHHVARFDDRLQRLAQTTFASIQHLLRSVKQTVAASQLPSTPAMSRWGGMPLLKISGLDWLSRQQREAAILTTLQRWFDPDGTTTRPRFDANNAVSALVEAVTPRAVATVLVPSDPLDAEHKPVESLAVTSGGEGVTVALILASLLAARRARSLGHRRTTLLLDNPFAKVNKPMFLRLARDVARSLGVQIVPLTGIRDLGALTVFPSLIQLRVSRRETANAVVPADYDDDRVQQLLRNGTLYVSAAELQAADAEANGDQAAWPVMSRAEVHWQQPLDLDFPAETVPDGNDRTRTT
jgi:hypothetical protein